MHRFYHTPYQEGVSTQISHQRHACKARRHQEQAPTCNQDPFQADCRRKLPHVKHVPPDKAQVNGRTREKYSPTRRGSRHFAHFTCIISRFGETSQAPWSRDRSSKLLGRRGVTASIFPPPLCSALAGGPKPLRPRGPTPWAHVGPRGPTRGNTRRAPLRGVGPHWPTMWAHTP